MEPELVALATAGATTLVQQMATDGWTAVRGRMAAFLARRRGTADEEAVEGELEVSRADLVAARQDGDQDGVDGVTTAWRLRLQRSLREDPAAAAELRALLDEVAPDRDDRTTVQNAYNTISGGVHTAPVIQVGFVSGNSSFHTPPGRPHSG
ncbi:hypothetical protein ACGFOU_18675 [Streptomyces sp. NPDC048595]|uniref:hypothetical protein n=1 Tax=Streptomyces sp. NPDC048595 TaxID=3365576 RepID=UPI003718B3F9